MDFLIDDFDSILPELSQDILNFLDEIEKQGIPESSQKQMQSAASRFKCFLSEKELPNDIENLPRDSLNAYLRYFYSQLKRRMGIFIHQIHLYAFVLVYIDTSPLLQLIALI